MDLEPALHLASELAGFVDAFNVTDNQNARLKLSPMAISHRLIEEGHDVIYQITCRDRNRLALQSDLLGAWSLKIRNVLALTGDHVTAGDHPDTAPVFDLDSIQLLSTIASLNTGRDMAGRELTGVPSFFPGAALACDQQPIELQMIRFRKKAAAGARFFQTQAVFGASSLRPFLEEADKRGIFIIGGILLIHSTSMIEYIKKNVPGLEIPDDVAARISSSADPVEAGLEEAQRIIEECRPFCHGIHLMAAGREKMLVDLVRRAGLP